MLSSKDFSDDITDLKYKVSHDSLTDVGNREGFDNAIKELKPAETSLISCDVNYLKKTNDEFGHAYGDTLLITIAGVLKEVFGANSVYRTGGDEFIVLLSNIGPKPIENKIALVETKLEELTKDDTDGLTYSLSMGYAIGTPTLAHKDIIALADKAMYLRKQELHAMREDTPNITNDLFGDLGVDDTPTEIKSDDFVDVDSDTLFGMQQEEMESKKDLHTELVEQIDVSVDSIPNNNAANLFSDSEIEEQSQKAENTSLMQQPEGTVASPVATNPTTTNLSEAALASLIQTNQQIMSMNNTIANQNMLQAQDVSLRMEERVEQKKRKRAMNRLVDLVITLIVVIIVLLLIFSQGFRNSLRQYSILEPFIVGLERILNAGVATTS